MASTSDFKNGLVLRHKNGLWKIVEFQHVKPGKGAAFVRSKLKNIKTGQVVEETFRAGERVETIRVESKEFNYSYNDGENYYFMDNNTFEQTSIQKNILISIIDFLVENTTVNIVFDGVKPIEVRIPQHMNLRVKKTDPGEKGNTAQGGTKPATLETNLTIHVPLFIKEGDVIRVDTRDKKYLERVKL